MPAKWVTVEKLSEHDLKIFRASFLKRRHPVWGKESNFVILDSADWVNIIPITKNKEIVLIEQYRHGSDSITLEIPGGLVEKGEEPRIAAERECTEETGFSSSEQAIELGSILPNPAFLNNRCYSYVWFDCDKVTEQKLDSNEDIKVTLIPLEQIRELVQSGKIDHSLVVNAFFLYLMKYGKSNL